MILEVCSLIGVGVLVRFGTVISGSTNFDSYGHLYFAKELHRQKAGPFGDIQTKVVGSSVVHKPFAWAWLVGFFPTDFLLDKGRWLNSVLDVVFSVLIYILAVTHGLGNNVGWVAAFCYLLTPAFSTKLAIGPRIQSLTPRLSSEIAVNLFFLLTLLPSSGLVNKVEFIISVFLAAFVLAASKFGVQALLLLTPVISILTLDFQPVAALISAILLVIVLSRGRWLRTTGEQLDHLCWYFRENLAGNMGISNRNSWTALIAPMKRFGLTTKGLVATLMNAISVNSLTGVLFKMPVLVFVIIGSWKLYGVEEIGHELGYLAGPCLGGVLIFLLINLPPLLFLGEAERYLNHVGAFICLAAAWISTVTGSWVVLGAILGYSILFWCCEVFILGLFRHESKDRLAVANAEVFEILKERTQASVVLCYPYTSLGIWRVMLETPHQTVHLNAHECSRELREKYSKCYPFVDLSKLDEMGQELGVDIAVIDREQQDLQGMGEWRPSRCWREVETSTNYYRVYFREGGVNDSSS